MKKAIMLLTGGIVLPLMLIACNDTEDRVEQIPVLNEMPPKDMPAADVSTEDVSIREEEIETLSESLFGVEGDVFLETDEFLYICSSVQIMRVDKETEETEVLWTSDNITEYLRLYGYSHGEAVLINNKIYFVETTESLWGCNYFLSVIDCNGSNYTRIGEFEDATYSMMYKDNKLYVFSYKKYVAYEILPDGKLVEVEKKETGYVDWLMTNLQRVTDSGAQFSGDLELWNEKYILSAEDSVDSDGIESGYAIYLTDIQTGESRLLAEFGEEGVYLLDMDNSYVYYRTWERLDSGVKIYIYKKLSISTGESSVLLSQNPVVGITTWQDRSENFMVPRVKNGKFYYIAQIDDKLYLAYVDVMNPNEEKLLGEAFYDSRISEVGCLIEEKENVYSSSHPDFCLTEIETYRLKVNEEFPGASKINKKLEEHAELILDLLDYDDLEEREQMLVEDDIYCYYSFYSCPSRIQYYDGKYLSFYQDEHYYYGGAHGMPYHEGYTFDLETGKELTLSDIVGNTDEELKEIVTTHYEIYMSSDPEVFWDDALEVVEESVNLEGDFYLCDNGIAFEFPPYDLAPYAAGYQTVVIPYSEFEIKIELE